MKPRAPATPAPRPPLGWLPAPLRAAVATTLLVINTLWWCGLLFVLAIVRLLLPWTAVRRVLDPWLNRVATAWIAGNSGWMRLTQRAAWDVDGIDDLGYRGWYLVVANHQSWVDIFVLQHLLNRRIPMLKFFLKQELIWVPVMGLAWWALDFPFMRRHSEAALLKHPEKRLEDVEATRRACAKFALVPTSVMNFVEGTRFTPAKHAAQHSRYRHLLKPKAGGLAMAMNALGERFDALLDVTIVYPDGAPTFGQFLRGDVRRIVVRAQRLPIPHELAHGDYVADSRYRKQVQRWLLELWHRKDAKIGELLAAAGVASAGAAALPAVDDSGDAESAGDR
ncbi:MAG: acyltransferase [Burkholderiaceae bacterium]|nr:acyltransferase [Burkholderiaceae bacterium]